MTNDTSVEILMLPVDLSETEKRVRAQELAARMTELEGREVEEKLRRKAVSDGIAELEKHIRELRLAVHSGREERPVECDLVYDHRAGLVSYFRRDTGEEARSRSMTEEEKESARQARLWGDDAPTLRPTIAELREPGRRDTLPPASKPSKPKRGPKASTVAAVDRELDGGV